MSHSGTAPPDSWVLIDPGTREDCRSVIGVVAFPIASVFATSDWLERDPNQARSIAQAMLEAVPHNAARWLLRGIVPLPDRGNNR